jgi:hypothetical protein
VRRIEVELEGAKAIVALDDARAPVTSGALWKILPFNGVATNAMWSGEAIVVPGVHLGVQEVENHISFLQPGTIVFTPLHEEIVISYGEAQFRYSAGPAFVTRLGVIDSNLDEFCREACRLLREGGRPITIRRT